MNKNQSSACYTIDADYNIITYNYAGKEIYPQLEIGKKCHKCLMNLDEPCPPCPVRSHIQGPQTYFDPIRKIYETVDAVEILLQDGTVGHSLVMSTTGEREAVSKQLPTTEKELTQLLNQDYYDRLTNGYSRNGFIREVGKVLEQDKSKKYAIVLLDIQHFKSINDIFGLTGGDRLLREMYDQIQKDLVRPIVMGRLESDHFVCLVDRDKLNLDFYERVTETEWNYEDRVVQIHFRCGIYLIEDLSVEVSQMIEWAFYAKEYAQKHDSVKFALFDDFMRKDYAGSAEIMSSFKRGMDENEFEVYYQPIVNAATNRIESAEALVRWNHKKLGFLMPGQFVPIIEKNGLITKLDRYVIRRVHDFLREHQNRFASHLQVAVNLSWQDFYDHTMMDEIIRFAQSGDLPRGSVNYEVTETSLSALNQNCAYILEQFQQCGARILLDDFGTGVSSLGMINNYSFDLVKIDRSFVRQIESGKKSRSLIHSIIQMCHRMGLRLVAEGVETQEQLDFLRAEGCDYLQGYYYAKPMCGEDFLRFVDEYNRSAEKSTVSDSKPVESGQSLDREFFKSVLDRVNYFVTAVNPDDYSLLYLNETSRSIAKCSDRPYFGEKCYQYMMGIDQPCSHCPKNRMDELGEKELVVDDGKYVFAVNASVQEINGKQVFVEIGRNITDAKELKSKYTEQIKSILAALPDGQGVFHVDVTSDKWISSDGNAQNARDMQNMANVDMLIRQIGSFVPDPQGQTAFFDTFCRQSMINAYRDGQYHISKDTLSYYDDGTIRMSRITAHLLMNPENNHLECLMYGIDISKQNEAVEHEYEEAQKVIELYTQADHDRRIDFLTGLKNRLELNEVFQNSKKNTAITAALMIDIDNFKKINDRYGHLVGDDCLRELGATLNRYGSAHGFEFFRYGGEEFLGLSFEAVDNMRTSAEEILEEIRHITISTPSGESFSFTASLGYTMVNQKYDKMVDCADRAMYIAKRMGKNRSCCYEELN